MLQRRVFRLTQAIALHNGLRESLIPIHGLLRFGSGTHIFGMGVLAARTVKAALVAAIAIVALVISLLPGLAEESGSLALTVSTCAARSRTVNCCNEGGPRAPSEARGIKAGASCVSGDGVPVLDQARYGSAPSTRQCGPS